MPDRLSDTPNQEACAALSLNALYMGFDFGERRTGVAIGQPRTETATPLATLHTRSGKQDWTAIQRLIDEWQPAALVVGQPMTANASIDKFCRQLHGRFGLSVHRVAEDYTSTTALSHLQGGGPQARQVHAPDIDKVSAAVLLESWLSNHFHD